MKRLAICTITVLALVTSCGVAKDDVAATVNGRDISSSDVAALARSEFTVAIAQNLGVGLVKSNDGARGAATQRLALSLLIQALVYDDEAKRRGLEVTADQMSAASEQIDSVQLPDGTEGGSELPARLKSRLARWLAVQSAIGRSLDIDVPELPQAEVAQPDPVTDEQVIAFIEDAPDRYGRMTCVEGFVLPVESRALGQAAVDRGDTLDAILGDPALTAQTLVEPGAASCLNEAQVTEPTIAPLVFGAAIGQWGSTTLESTDPTDPTAALTLAVFIRPTLRDDAVNIPAIIDYVRSGLEQEAQGRADAANEAAQQAQSEVIAGVQAEVERQLAELVAEADVDIDPRYGSFDPDAIGGFTFDLVSPPPAPVDRAPTTTMPILLDPSAG